MIYIASQIIPIFVQQFELQLMTYSNFKRILGTILVSFLFIKFLVFKIHMFRSSIISTNGSDI